jgi:PPM family protein phosphatase
MNSNPLQQNLYNWFMRKTISGAIRRVADLPMAIATDIGLVRKENQDRAAIIRIQLSENKPTIIAVLCDGMGGMADGAICSSLATSIFLSTYVQNINIPIKDRIISSVKQANDAIFAKYNGTGGSTLSAFIMDNQEGILGVNVGDSRIYSIEDHVLSQMTIDDTLEGQLARDNEDAYGRNELLQYIGMGQGIEPHIISLSDSTKSPNILLTSDGIHFLDKRTMELITENATDSALAIKRLIELAKWCGGHDNASAIVANFYTMTLENSNLNRGELEVWDAFGELRVIIAQNSTTNTESSKSVLEIKTVNKEKVVKKPRNQKRSTSTSSSLKEKKIKKKEGEHAETKATPQLQIDFENK